METKTDDAPTNDPGLASRVGSKITEIAEAPGAFAADVERKAQGVANAGAHRLHETALRAAHTAKQIATEVVHSVQETAQKVLHGVREMANAAQHRRQETTNQRRRDEEHE